MSLSTWLFLIAALAIIADVVVHILAPKPKTDENAEALLASYATIDKLKEQRTQAEHQVHFLTRQVAYLQENARRNRAKLAEADALFNVNNVRETKQRQEAHLNTARHAPAGIPSRSSDVLRSTDDSSRHDNVVPLWQNSETPVHSTDHGSHHSHDSSSSPDSCSSYDTSSPSSDSGSGGGGGCD
ncbi:hypothetical protein D3C85_744400 [compost metagenome]